MDNWWLVAMVADYRRRDLLRQAEQERLIREGRSHARRGVRLLIAPLLARSLVEWIPRNLLQA